MQALLQICLDFLTSLAEVLFITLHLGRYASEIRKFLKLERYKCNLHKKKNLLVATASKTNKKMAKTLEFISNRSIDEFRTE